MDNHNEVYMGPSVSEVAREQYRKNFSFFLPYLIAFGLIILSIIVIAFFTHASLILTVPFLFAPFFFGFEMLLIDESEKPTLGNNAKWYFTPKFSGCFRLGWSFLYAIGFYFLAFMVTFGIYYLVAQQVDPNFINALNNYAETITQGNLEAITALLSDYTNPVVIMTTVTSIVSYAALALIFIHHLAKRGAVPYLLSKFKNLMGGRNGNILLGTFLKRRGREYRIDYYKSNWLGIVLLVTGFALGTVLAYFLLPYNISFSLNTRAVLCVVFGLLGAFIFLLLYVPYYCYVMKELIDRYEKEIIAVNDELNKEALEYLKRMKELNDMQARFYEDAIRDSEFKQENDPENEDDEDDAPKNNLDDYGRGDHS